MIESHIIYSESLKIDRSLEDSLRDDENFRDVFDEALSKLIDDMTDRGYDVRRCCKRLTLQASVAKTASFDGAKSAIDTINRRRLVLSVTAITESANAVFQLQGTNDTTAETYINIGQTISVASISETYLKLTTLYKYYRVQLTSLTSGSVTYSAYLVESSFEEAHELRFFMMCYDRLRFRVSDDSYELKYRDFKEKYELKLDSMSFWYDRDDDGTLIFESKKHKML